MVIQHGYADVNGERLHYATAGSGKLMLFLHGFPDFWRIWRRQLEVFGRTHQVVAPDMRGYNLSSKPVDVHAYELPILVEDIASLVDYFGHPTATVVGHDWGGVVAWEFAQAHRERVERLVIINAPHPAVFRRELAHNAAQQRASQYLLRFRSPRAEAVLSANTFAVLTDSVVKPGRQQGYFTEEDANAYVTAWSQPGALTGALNYYRAADFRPGMTFSDAVSDQSGEPLSGVVTAPTLVIWGEQDTVLLAGNLEGLEQYVPRVRIERVPDASHAIIHEKPDLLNTLIHDFMEEKSN